MEKLERKDFLLMTGGAVVGGATGTLFSGAPFNALQWVVEWTQDQHVPAKGQEKLIKSICGACSNRCEIKVRMIADRAVKIETSNVGCPQLQLMLQMLYHPERIKQPLKRIGRKGSNNFTPVSWDEVINGISSKLQTLCSENRSDQIAAITSSNPDISNILIKKILNAAGSPHIFVDPSLDSISNEVVKLTQKIDGSIYYDFDNADYILSFGARFLEGWGEASRISNAFSRMKKNGARIVHIDTLCTRTASIADSWIPISPGGEGVLALGIAYFLIKKGKRSKGADFANWSQTIINQYFPKRVTQITGVKASTIEGIADELIKARRPIAIGGRGGKDVSSSLAELAAVHCLNSLLGNIGQKGGVLVKILPDADNSPKTLKRGKSLDEFVKNGKDLDLLFINDADPVHKSVYGKPLLEMMEKIPMVISFTPLINDTACYADYILPTLSILETATSAGSEPVRSRQGSMHAGDVILKIAKKTDVVKNSLPWASYKDLIKSTDKIEINNTTNFIFPTKIFKNYISDISKKTVKSSEYPLILMPFERPIVADGRGLAYPYVLKGLDGKTLLGNKLWVEINPLTAEKYGISEGSTIDIQSARGEIEDLKVHITKTVAPNVVAIPLGFGHIAFTKYAEGKGVNPKKIMSDEIDPLSGITDWWCTRIKIS